MVQRLRCVSTGHDQIMTRDFFLCFLVTDETADKNTACLLSPLGSLLKVVPMIDPPSQQPGQPERKVELDQTVDFAVQLLVEEAHLVGWTRSSSSLRLWTPPIAGSLQSRKSANGSALARLVPKTTKSHKNVTIG